MSDWRQAIFISFRCLLRRLPLFFSTSPRTGLRVLGIVALDTLHVRRCSQPLPKSRVRELAWFLDFEGGLNARADRKPQVARNGDLIRRDLQAAGYGARLRKYLTGLRLLERSRPGVGGDLRRFVEVRTYREDVARLALTSAAVVALHGPGDSTPDPVADDADVDTLFRILMQCQIIDDVLDYPADHTAGLPTFLTASASWPANVAMASAAARSYGVSSPRAMWPFRAVLWLFTRAALLTLAVAHRRQEVPRQVAAR